MTFKHLVVAATAAACAMLSPALLAHARLESSTPQANSVVSPAPAVIRLQFSAPLEAPFSKVRLVDQQGKTINPTRIAVDPANTKVLAASIPALHAGAYRVQWTTITRDGHKVKGEFSFRVK